MSAAPPVEAPVAPTLPPRAIQAPSARRATSDVHPFATLAVAAPLYGAAYLAARLAPPHVRELLLQRGWVPHAILVLTSLALAILVQKAFAIRSQRRAFALELLPEGVSTVSTAEVTAVVAHVDRLRSEWSAHRLPRSFVLERARRVLDHFALRGDLDDTVAYASADADAEASAVASSLSTVKVLVWAIPILGFIGTVIGISDAVAGFSRSLSGAEQLDAIKGSLGEVTTGLAVAFDSTLVALVASIAVMLPMSWVQRSEEQLMAEVDDHTLAHVTRRLRAKEGSPEASFAPRSEPASFGALSRSLEQGLVVPVRDGLAQVLASHSRVLSRLAEERGAVLAVQAELAERLTSFAAAAQELGPGVHRAVTQLERSGALAERSAEAAERAQEQLARELGASRQLLALLAAGMGAGDRVDPRKDLARAALEGRDPVPARANGAGTNGNGKGSHATNGVDHSAEAGGEA